MNHVTERKINNSQCVECAKLSDNAKWESEEFRNKRANPKQTMINRAKSRAAKKGLLFDLKPSDFDIPDVSYIGNPIGDTRWQSNQQFIIIRSHHPIIGICCR